MTDTETAQGPVTENLNDGHKSAASAIEVITNVATEQQLQAARLRQAQDEIASLHARISDMETLLQKADGFLSRVKPETLERILEIIDKWHQHGA